MTNANTQSGLRDCYENRIKTKKGRKTEGTVTQGNTENNIYLIFTFSFQTAVQISAYSPNSLPSRSVSNTQTPLPECHSLPLLTL